MKRITSKKGVTRVLTAAVLLVALTSCGEPNKLTTGKVIDKDYDDADTYFSTYCMTYGSNGLCNAYGVRNTYEPEHCSLKIRGVDGKEDLVEWHSVPCEQYSQIHIGEHWSK